MKKADPYYRVATAVFAICFTAFLSYFVASGNKITAQEATSIAQTQARLMIQDDYSKILQRLSNIEGQLQFLAADLSKNSQNTRMRN